MDTFTIDQLSSLFDRRPGWCVSLYLPTHRTGREVREDPIRLKNRLSEAERQLEEAGVAGGDIKRLLQPATDLCDFDKNDNRDFWQHQSDGLALFLSEDADEQYRLPEKFEELTVVAHRFHVEPLLGAAQQDGQYCVLAVSQNGVRFLEGSRSGLSEQPIQDLPESLQAVVGTEHHKGFNLHSFRVRANAGDAATPHGHVESNEEHELKRYFRTIDSALNDALKSDKRPLVFAGVEELFPYFRNTSDYDALLDEAVRGNPDDMSPQELHEKAWPLASQALQSRRQELIDRWQAAAKTDVGSTSLNDIVTAAHDGRIETLLLVENRHQWGTYDEESRTVKQDKESSAENYDLLDLAAIRTLQTDGRLLIVTEEELSLSDGAAAVFRYAAA